MSQPKPPGFREALEALRDSLEEAGAPWMCLGGVAVIAQGVPRLTVDIDATVLAEKAQLAALLEACGRHEVRPRIDDALAFAREHHVLLLHHTPSDIPLDVSLAWLPFEEEAIRAAPEIDYAGVRIRVARPEDLIVYKMVASRPRDIEDVDKLLLLHGDRIDLDRIRAVLREFCQVLEDNERLEILERMIETL